MPYQITVDLQHLAEGADVHIDGLGTFQKGGTNLVSDDAALAYQNLNIGHEDAYAYEYDEEGNIKVDEQGHKIGEVVGQAQVIYDFVDLVERYQGISAVEVLDIDDIDFNKDSATTGDDQPKGVDPAEVGKDDGTASTAPGNTSPESGLNSTSEDQLDLYGDERPSPFGAPRTTQQEGSDN